MKNKGPKIIIIVLVITIIISACPILMREPIFMDSQQIRFPDVLFNSYGNRGSYEFNPETILESLKRGNEDVFTPIAEASREHIYSTSFPWKQSDYLMIADALHQFVWKETVEDWSLHDMVLYGDCQYNPIGFDIIKISYYKVTGLQQYSAHMIGIYPLSGEGEWGGGEKFPRSLFSRWNYIDLEKLKVTSEGALQIAEDNGGMLARLAANNQCSIQFSLSSYPYPRWRVTYYSNRSPRQIFEMTIDAYTNKYEILSTYQ